MAIANAITFVLIQPDFQRYGYDFVIFKMAPLLLSLCITEWGYLFNQTIKINDLPSMLYKSVFYCTFAFAIFTSICVRFLLSVSIHRNTPKY